jgi:7-cyano-7-deazaguanine reductase
MTQVDTGEHYGARMIRENHLVALDNRNLDRDYTVQLTIPEFTCLCPISGFPDFATIRVRYVPGSRIVELKSLKLYVNGFRNQGLFHEDVPNVILGDLAGLLEPRYIEVVGDFSVRGNIKTIVQARQQDPAWSGQPAPWWNNPATGTAAAPG